MAVVTCCVLVSVLVVVWIYRHIAAQQDLLLGHQEHRQCCFDVMALGRARAARLEVQLDDDDLDPRDEEDVLVRIELIHAWADTARAALRTSPMPTFDELNASRILLHKVAESIERLADGALGGATKVDRSTEDALRLARTHRQFEEIVGA